MKAFLMFRDRDFDLNQPLPPNADALVQDLELETLFGAMAAGDPLIHDVSKVGSPKQRPEHRRGDRVPPARHDGRAPSPGGAP